MRKIFLLFITFFQSYSLYSFDYNPFKKNQTSFFKDSQNEIWAMAIDSLNNQNYSDFRFGNNISWTGRKIIIKKDEFLFTNISNDTIIIKPYSSINESWLCYSDNSGLMINARISKLEISKFLNISDSTKTISFQAIDSLGNIIDHKVNSYEMVISKNFGVIKWFNIYLFPNNSIFRGIIESDIQCYKIKQKDSISFDKLELIGIETPTQVKGIGPISFKEIFNFNTGDQLHTVENYCWDWHGDKMLKITGTINYFKNKGTDNPSNLSYDVEQIVNIFTEVTQRNHLPVNEVSDTSFSHSVKFIFDERSFEKLLPGQLNQNNYVYNLNLTEDNRLMAFYTSNIGNNQLIQFVWKAYVVGLGGPYYTGLGSCPPNLTSNTLVYLKKGNQEKGDALNIVPLSIDDPRLEINIFPIPAQDFLKIELKGASPARLNLLNDKGQVVLKLLTKGGNRFQIPVAALTKGVYILEVVQGSIYSLHKVLIIK